MNLTRDEARDVINKHHGDWDVASDVSPPFLMGILPDWKSRAGQPTIARYNRVFKHKPTGKFYRFTWYMEANRRTQSMRMRVEMDLGHTNECSPVEVHLVEQLVRVWDKI